MFFLVVAKMIRFLIVLSRVNLTFNLFVHNTKHPFVLIPFFDVQFVWAADFSFVFMSKSCRKFLRPNVCKM
jgi:hypothetical protein